MRNKANWKVNRILAEKKCECECGCGNIIKLKGWHFVKGAVIPKFIPGHNIAVFFKLNNKIGWKGGQIKCNGYWYIYSPEYPNANAMGAGYIKQCRLLMEKKLGRILTRSEAVHHLNGARDDDRPENLMVLTRSEHMREHSSKNVLLMRRNSRGQFMREGGDAHGASDR